VLHHWCQTLDKGGSVRGLFVDFSKAFDRVDHNVIVSKLIDRGAPHCLIRWICSYLNDRRQSVRIDGQYSNWLSLAGGMPQGSLIGPLTFILLIDDLRLQCLTHKYVDDTTLTELLPRGSSESRMQLHFQDLHGWTTYNKMKINYTKTKEMILDPLAKSPPDLLSHCSTTDASLVIERVKFFKLLGINISHDFSWQTHVDLITSKAASRLHFLRV